MGDRHQITITDAEVLGVCGGVDDANGQPVGAEDEPVLVRYALLSGEVVEYDAGFHNPFAGR